MEHFKSIKSNDLAELCNNFVELKRVAGLKYKAEAKSLSAFARYCNNLYLNSDIPDDIVCIWIDSNPNQSLKTKCNYKSLMVEFAKYLFSLGYVPLKIPLLKERQNTAFVPHIFTSDEMTAIWKKVDTLEPLKRCPNLHHCLPVLFRLLYSTGLRISEALSITTESVDFENNVIKIEYAKYDKERLIPMSDTLASVLKRYLHEHTQAIDAKAPIFYYHKDFVLTPETVYKRFRQTYESCGIPYMGKLRGPRLHDLRHTFSVNAMNKLVDDGKDLYAILPILSTYLGHSSLKSTERYIRLTEDRLSGITECVSSIMPTFPEVKANGEI